MGEQPTAKDRALKTESLADALSKLNISKQELKIRSVLPDTSLKSQQDGVVPDLGNAARPVKEVLQNEGDILMTQEDFLMKQKVDDSILNAKKLYELSNPAGVKQKTAKEAHRKGMGGTLMGTKPRSPTRDKHIGPPKIPKTNSRNPRKGATVSEIMHPAKPKRTGHMYSLPSKLKKAISFGPLSSPAKIASVQTPGSKNRHYSKVVTNIVQRLGGKTSASSASLQAASKGKDPSPKASKKGKSQHRTRKTSTKRGKSEIPVTENNFFTTINSVDNAHDVKHADSREKITRLTKKRNKSRSKLKASTSLKPNRSARLATLSTPRLSASPSPRSLMPRSVTRLSDANSSKRVKRTGSVSKLSLSKSATSTKRPNSVMSKPEQKQTITSRKTKSVYKLHEVPDRPVSVARTGKISITNSSVQILSTARSQDSKMTRKPPNRRCSSAMLLQVGEADTNKIKPNINKSKSKTLNNANANNVNDADEEERLRPSLQSVSSLSPLCADTQTEATTNRGSTKVSYDDLVVLSGQINDTDNVLHSRYSPQEPITINIGKLTDKTDVTTPELENTVTNCSPQITENRGNRLYSICFMDLVKNGVEEDTFQSTSYRTNRLPKPGKQKVRFNVHLAESIARDLKNGPLRLEAAMTKQKGKKYETLGYGLGDTDNSAKVHRRPRSVHSPDHSVQLVCKYEAQKWPNIWATVLKSRKWRELYSLPDSCSATDVDEESSKDEESEPGEFPYGLEYRGSAPEMSLKGRKSLETPKKVRKKHRHIRHRRQRVSSARANENPPNEVIFPPYTWSYTDEESSDLSTENSSSAACGFLQSDFMDANASKNSEGDAGSPVPKIPLCSNKRHSKFQLKWLHLVEHMTREIQQECLLKGYEILQRVSRGHPRVHSLLFLANNKSNLEYTPVEVAAIRRPYACFTSSVISLGGSSTHRQYIQTWVNALPPHSNLVMLLHRFCTNNWVYHVTQHCPWPSLEHLIKQTTKRWGLGACQGLRENACKTIFKQICSGMEHLHHHEVLHGDLNCSNVLVSNMLQVKLAGYGPVCQRMMSPLQTIKGHVPLQGDSYNVNTPPELMARRDVWTKSCDVWCMGITLLQMAIGEIPQEVNSAIRLSGCNNPVTRLHLPSCGYQLSRLIDKILQPNASNRPSVFHIRNHPWLCDGTDLATVLWQRSNKNAARRTDGSTFPLPKRLQNPENRSDENFYADSESDYSVSDTVTDSYDILGSQDRDEDDTYSNQYSSDYLSNLHEEPSCLNTAYYRCGVSENWLSDNDRLVSSLSSTTTLSSSARQEPFCHKSLTPKMSLVSSGTALPERHALSFINEGLEIEGIGIVYRNSITERQTGNRMSLCNVANDYQVEKHRGCDLLKLMENLAPVDWKMEAVN